MHIIERLEILALPVKVLAYSVSLYIVINTSTFTMHQTYKIQLINPDQLSLFN